MLQHRRFGILLGTLLLFISTATYAQPAVYFDLIRVRTLKSQAKINISGFGIRLQGENLFINKSILPTRTQILVVRANGGWSIASVGNIESQKFYSGDVLKISGDMLKLDGIDANDDLILSSKGKETFDVIARLNIEEYLKGVLPSEMPAKWPLEALKAQAIAARSYALSVMAERTNEDFHVDDTVDHQVFQMQNFTGASYELQQKILTAIQETKGMHLTNSKGEPYRTYFHSDCGGTTEEPKNIWGLHQNNGTVVDERCQLNPISAWQTEINKTEIEAKLIDIMKLQPGAKLSAMTVASSTDSGRVHELLIHFLNSSGAEDFRAISGQDFRRTFGFNRVKSTNFEMTFNNKTLLLKGRGHGHGAGMCQKGARFMALAGAKSLEIIKRYYPRANIKL
jgi:stage II sporulation protein D